MAIEKTIQQLNKKNSSLKALFLMGAVFNGLKNNDKKTQDVATALKDNTAVTSLTLSGWMILDKATVPIMLAKSSNLKTLHFQFCEITVEGAQYLARALAKMPALEQVDFTFCSFSEGAGKFLRAYFTKTLRKSNEDILRNIDKWLAPVSHAKLTSKNVIDLEETPKVADILKFIDKCLALEGKHKSKSQSDECSENPAVSSVLANLDELLAPVKILSMKLSKNTLEMYKAYRIFINSCFGFCPMVEVDNAKHSGWKIHVYGNSTSDAETLIVKLCDMLEKHQATAKVATQRFFKGYGNTHQHGKAVTIYLPYDLVAKGGVAVKEFVNELNTCLKGYDKEGIIAGDRLCPNLVGNKKQIYYAYEYTIPFDKLPLGGVQDGKTRGYYQYDDKVKATDYLRGTKQTDLFDRKPLVLTNGKSNGSMTVAKKGGDSSVGELFSSDFTISLRW